MSKNSKKPSQANKNPGSDIKPEAKKKSKTAIIIIAAVLALCAGVAAVLLIMHFSDKKPDENKESGAPISTQASNFSGELEQKGEYKGCAMPEKYAGIMAQADEDSIAACKKYGEAMKIGSRSLSVPEYVFKYYRTEVNLFMEAMSSVQTKGGNYTGFDPMKRAEEQQSIADKKMWNEKIDEVIGDYYGRLYCVFDMALADGYYPDDGLIRYLENELSEIEASAKERDMTPDELMAETYSEGFTYAMFVAEEIIVNYCDGYESSTKQALADGYSDEEIRAIYDADPLSRKQVNMKIYTVENESNVEEAKAVKTLDAFYALAKKDKGIEGYDPENATECYCFDKQVLSDMFGEAVAEWAFSPDRRQGEFGFAQGAIYPCVMYMTELPKETHSSTVLIYNITADGFDTAEELHEYSESENKKLLEGGLTPDEFREYIGMAGQDSADREVYTNQFEVLADRWVHSPERKPGDTYILKGDMGDSIICFVKDNPERTNWNASIRKNKAQEEKDSEIDAAVTAYAPLANAKNIKAAQKSAGDKFAAFAEKNKEVLNPQQ